MLMSVCVFPGASPTVISTPTPTAVTVHPEPHPPQVPLPVLEHGPPQVHTHLSLSRNKCTPLTPTETPSGLLIHTSCFRFRRNKEEIDYEDVVSMTTVPLAAVSQNTGQRKGSNQDQKRRTSDLHWLITAGVKMNKHSVLNNNHFMIYNYFTIVVMKVTNYNYSFQAVKCVIK